MLKNNTKCVFIENNTLIFYSFTKQGWEQEAEIGLAFLQHTGFMPLQSLDLYFPEEFCCVLIV